MKIVRIIARLNVGGPARHVVFLTEALQDEEFQSTLIAGRVPEGEEDMSFFASEHGIEPYYIREMSRELSPKDVISVAKILARIRREKPDIIHTHTAKAGTLGRIAAFLYRWGTPGILIGRPRKVKVVHTFHGHVFHSYYGGFKSRVFLTIERALARVATDRIIVISPKQYEEISTDYRVGRPEMFKLVPLGIDITELASNDDERRSFRSALEVASKDILVTFVGRLTEIKNIPLLLEAIHLFRTSEAPQQVSLRFAIVGDGHLRKELEERSAALGIDGLLTFVGNRRDASRFYSGADVIVLTSRNEGTPLSLIEAMAAGRAVVATGVGGVIDLLGEIVEEKEGFCVCERGVRVDTFDPRDLLEGLIYLANNEKLRLELATRGKSFVESKYSKERLVDDIKTLYRELVAE